MLKRFLSSALSLSSGALIVTLALASTDARSAETDQFYAWRKSPRDSLQILNSKVNRDIVKALRSSSSEDSCPRVVRKILSKFKATAFHKIELWAAMHPSVDRSPSLIESPLDSLAANIYSKRKPWDLQVLLPPSPTIKINGIHLGTDKLGHFFVQGYRYYERYQESSAQRGIEAWSSAIDRGVFQEKHHLGLGTSAVFSYADLESNYQGFRFWSGLCAPELSSQALEGLEPREARAIVSIQGSSLPRLIRTEKGWQLSREFDWREFVNPNWDETHNPSAFAPHRWKSVRKSYRRICGLRGLPQVVALKKYYGDPRWIDSPSVLYLRSEIEAGHLPDPSRQRLEWVCAESEAAGAG